MEMSQNLENVHLSLFFKAGISHLLEAVHQAIYQLVVDFRVPLLV